MDLEPFDVEERLKDRSISLSSEMTEALITCIPETPLGKNNEHAPPPPPPPLKEEDLSMIKELPLDQQELDPFIDHLEQVEDDCYSYLTNEIVNNDLLRNTVRIFRHNTGFYLVSKMSDDVWASGMITTRGFLIKYHCDSPDSPESGMVLDVRKGFVKLVELKLNEKNKNV